jgi:hypothetical protein
MRRVRMLLVIGLVLLMASACADSGKVKSLPDNPENRNAAAKRYLQAMPPKDMLQSLATRVAPNLPEKDRKTFVEVMQSPDLEKAADRITLEGLVKNFTVGELDAMTAFYGSPEGKSASKKFGPYMMAVMPQIQHEVKKAMDAKQKEAGAQCPPATKDKPEAAAPPAAKPGAKPAAPPAASKASPAPVAPKTPEASKAAPAPKEAPAPKAPVAPAPPAAPPAPKEAPSK